MDSDVAVLWEQGCGKDNAVPFRDHHIFLDRPAPVRVWSCTSAAHCGCFGVQQGSRSVCRDVFETLSIGSSSINPFLKPNLG